LTARCQGKASTGLDKIGWWKYSVHTLHPPKYADALFKTKLSVPHTHVNHTFLRALTLKPSHNEVVSVDDLAELVKKRELEKVDAL
jgi:hypothetical protein